jgi:SPP1 gp7 family putative phage head morphogenesis protein
MKKSDRIIADKILANQMYLQRFTAGEKKRMFKILLDMQTELKMKLTNGFTDLERKRIKKLLADCETVIKTYYSDLQTMLDLPAVAKQQMIVTQKAIGSIHLEPILPDASTMKAILSDQMLYGAPLKDWWAKQAGDVAFKFSAQVRQGMLQGENLQQIITRITGSVKHNIPGIMETSRRNASTLVHDAIMQTANDAKMLLYKENEDILNGVEWLATFDMNTCESCAGLHGAAWDLDGNNINGTTQSYEQAPLHPNCRCLMVPITKSYKELGLDVPESNAGTRASDLGQVPADMTFSEFLKRHDEAYQDAMLGKGRAEMWRDGKITLSDLVMQNGRPITLEQLRAGL